MKAAGLQTLNDKCSKFNSFMRRLNSLPLVPKSRIQEALQILEKLKDGQQEIAQKFCGEILTLIRNTYISGQYCLEDWNVFDIDLVDTPITNNGNEGTNKGLAEEFGVHPQANRWFGICCDVLESAEDKIQQLLYGSIKPRKNEVYAALKQKREVLKGNLVTNEITLSEYMGQLGALTLKIGKSRFLQNFSEEDFEKETENMTDITVALPKKKQVKRKRANDDEKETEKGPKRARNTESIVPGTMGRRPVIKFGKKNTKRTETVPSSITTTNNSTANDSLLNHIKMHILPVTLTDKMAPPLGNCFYEAVTLLCKKLLI